MGEADDSPCFVFVVNMAHKKVQPQKSQGQRRQEFLASLVEFEQTFNHNEFVDAAEIKAMLRFLISVLRRL